MLKEAGSVALTHIPVINLIIHRTINEFVLPDTKLVMLHAIHAMDNSVFLFTLSTRRPMKIPAIEYEILKAGPLNRL